MSSMLFVALLATFGAIALGGYAWNLSFAERRRALDLLRTEVADVQVRSLRDAEMSRSFTVRVVLPTVERFAGIVRRLTPLDARKRLAKKLVLAGSPAGWDMEKLAALKFVGLAGGALLGFGLMRTLGASAGTALAAILVLAFIGYFGPDGVLDAIGRKRQEEIRAALPDTMDLLTISVEAGLGFDAALAQVQANVPGVLTQEIGRMLHEMRLGVSRVEALRHLADRTDVDELRSFVLTMVQAETFGVGISGVLRSQSKELRLKRRQLAEEKAMKVPVKILFPLVFCVLPALFVIVLGPGVVRIAHTLFGIAP